MADAVSPASIICAGNRIANKQHTADRSLDCDMVDCDMVRITPAAVNWIILSPKRVAGQSALIDSVRFSARRTPSRSRRSGGNLGIAAFAISRFPSLTPVRRLGPAPVRADTAGAARWCRGWSGYRSDPVEGHVADILSQQPSQVNLANAKPPGALSTESPLEGLFARNAIRRPRHGR